MTPVPNPLYDVDVGVPYRVRSWTDVVDVRPTPMTSKSDGVRRRQTLINDTTESVPVSTLFGTAFWTTPPPVSGATFPVPDITTKGRNG